MRELHSEGRAPSQARIGSGLSGLLGRPAPEDGMRAPAGAAAFARAALSAAGATGVWEWSASAARLHADPVAASLLRLPAAAAPGGTTAAEVLEALHPGDRRALLRLVRQSAQARGRGPVTGEFRLAPRPGGAGWIALRGRWSQDPEGRLLLRGTITDHTPLKLAEEEQAMLLREAEHRARNSLALTFAVLRLTEAEDVGTYRAAVEGRLSALARAGQLAQPQGWTELGTLLQAEVSPFLDSSQALELSGAAVALPPETARMLALIVHELAVNATKHGALSTRGGRILAGWRALPAGRLVLRWTELGGPRPATPKRRGGGSTLLEAVVARRLGGTLSRRLTPSGLVCEITIPVRPAAG